MKCEEAIREIEELSLQDCLCQRVSSYRIIDEGDSIDIYAWQCNMADIKNIDIKLPTSLHINADSGGYVNKIELLDNFKGSQGIPCSHSYLDRKLKHTINGVSLLDEKSFTRGKISFDCQHINELMYGIAALFRYGKKKGTYDQDVYNCTRAVELENGIQIIDEFDYCGRYVKSESNLYFDRGQIKMDREGKLKKIDHLHLNVSILQPDRNRSTIEDVVEKAETNDLVVMYLMKSFTKVWRNIGAAYGMRGELYFSNLFPAAFYGMFVQSLALMLYPENYNYFQHSVSGLQRVGGKPLCIGMINSMEEAEQYFESFSQEDLYG